MKEASRFLATKTREAENSSEPHFGAYFLSYHSRWSLASPECGSVSSASLCFCKSLSPKPFPLDPHPSQMEGFPVLSQCALLSWGPLLSCSLFSGPGMQGVGPSAAKTGSGSLGQQLHFRPQPQRQPLRLVRPAPLAEHIKLRCLYWS